jgi:hypothetical protein
MGYKRDQRQIALSSMLVLSQAAVGLVSSQDKLGLRIGAAGYRARSTNKIGPSSGG